MKLNVKQPKGSTKVSEGGYGYAGGVRVTKSSLGGTKLQKVGPALTATKTKVLQIARFPKQSAVNAFKKWLASSPYKYSKNTSIRKIKNVFSVNKNTQNLIMSTKNVKTGKWTKKKITSKEFSELK